MFAITKIVVMGLLLVMIGGCSGINKCMVFKAEQGTIVGGPVTASGKNVSYHSLNDLCPTETYPGHTGHENGES